MSAAMKRAPREGLRPVRAAVELLSTPPSWPADEVMGDDQKHAADEMPCRQRRGATDISGVT